MSDDSTKEQTALMVEAESKEKAVETLEEYYRIKSGSYDTSYTLIDYDVVETIKQVDILKQS